MTQEEMLSCDTRRHLFLFHKKTFLLVAQEEFLLVTQESISSYTGGMTFLLYLMSCILNAPTILGVSEGMCSINLGGLQADLPNILLASDSGNESAVNTLKVSDNGEQ